MIQAMLLTINTGIRPVVLQQLRCEIHLSVYFAARHHFARILDHLSLPFRPLVSELAHLITWTSVLTGVGNVVTYRRRKLQDINSVPDSVRLNSVLHFRKQLTAFSLNCLSCTIYILSPRSTKNIKSIVEAWFIHCFIKYIWNVNF